LRRLTGLFDLAGAAVCVYALGRYLGPHKIEDSYRFAGAIWRNRLPNGEILFLCGFVVAGGLAAALLTRALGEGRGRALAALCSRRRAVALCAVLAVAAVLSLHFWLLRPHFYEDEVGCGFAARVLTSGHLRLPSPPFAQGFASRFVADRGGQRLGLCAPVSAGLVALARALGPAGGLVYALCAGAIVLLCAGLARELSDDRAVAGLAALLCASSPMLLAMAATTTSAVLATLAGLGVARATVALARERTRRAYVALGVAVGLGLLIDPLTIGVIALVALPELAVTVSGGARGFAWTALSALPLVALAFGAGWPIPSALNSPETANLVGRTGALAARLVRANAWLFGWPCSLAPLALALLLGIDRRCRLPLCALLGVLVLGWLFPDLDSATAGSRLLLPALPFAAVLSAHALVRARDRLGRWPLVAALACQIVAFAGFWRLCALPQLRALAVRQVTVAARAAGVQPPALVLCPGEVDYLPPALSAADPILYVREEQAGYARVAAPGRRLYRFDPVAGKVVPAN
jgi:hypothetical protein